MKELVNLGIYLYCNRCDIHSKPFTIGGDDNFSNQGIFCLKHQITCGQSYDAYDTGCIRMVYRSLFNNDYYFDNVKIDKDYSMFEINEFFITRKNNERKTYVDKRIKDGLSEFEAYKEYNIRAGISEISLGNIDNKGNKEGA